MVPPQLEWTRPMGVAVLSGDRARSASVSAAAKNQHMALIWATELSTSSSPPDARSQPPSGKPPLGS